MRLKDKTALITGAATGIEGHTMGFRGATARLFAKEGANVVLTDINEESGKITASQIKQTGANAVFLKLDVTNESEWEQVIRQTVSNFGSLDILINGAGFGERNKLVDTTTEIWDGQMDVHAKGVFLGTKHAVKEMKKAGKGSIVNISSIFGLVGSPINVSYPAGKGAIRIFTKSAAIQYATDGIRINSIHPGFATTPMTEKAFSNPDFLADRLAYVPMGRLASPDEIAYGILYLSSDEASFTTGTELIIDGGMTAQ